MIQLKKSHLSYLFASTVLAACASTEGDTSRTRVEERTEPVTVDVQPDELEPDFDPCEELRRQLAEARREYSVLGARNVAEKSERSRLALEEARADAAAARDAATHAAREFLAAQNELRRVETTRFDEADAFCREILDLSGIGEHGALAPQEAAEGDSWTAFAVLEDPATDVYYHESADDPNSGERNRIALQETMFTEFPKFWDRTRETRERLNLATLALASSKRARKEADEAAHAARTKVEEARERWYAGSEAARRADAALVEMLELERSLERCAGGEGLAGRIRRIELRIAGLQQRADEARADFDRTYEEVAAIAPSGYRGATEKHLDAAWQLLDEIDGELATVHGYHAGALHAFAQERRDEARAHATRAQRSCDQIEEGLTDTAQFFERARFAAQEGRDSYFKDGLDVRERNSALARMDLDNLLLGALRDGLPPEELQPAWTEVDLWASLPGWLSAFETGNSFHVPEEALEPVLGLHTFLAETLRPCEPTTIDAGLRASFERSGRARTDLDGYRMLGELCGLTRRIEALLSAAQ